MATLTVIHGGGDSASSWAWTLKALRELGHTALAVDLPIESNDTTWAACADAVAASVRGQRDVVVVAHSLGGFVAPLVCSRAHVTRVLLVAAMIPTPHAIAMNYSREAGYTRGSFDDETFFHDLSPDARAVAKRAERAQAEHLMHEPLAFSAWPDVHTRYLLCANDRLFPAPVTRRVVRERLGIKADEIDAGHCVQLAQPEELARRLHQYAVER